MKTVNLFFEMLKFLVLITITIIITSFDPGLFGGTSNLLLVDTS